MFNERYHVKPLLGAIMADSIRKPNPLDPDPEKAKGFESGFGGEDPMVTAVKKRWNAWMGMPKPKSSDQ